MHDNDGKGSPTAGMIRKGQVHWCYEVMVRLLITVFSDMAEIETGYFVELLGGPTLGSLQKRNAKKPI